MLHVVDGTWQPNSVDDAANLEPGLGATIMIINGGVYVFFYQGGRMLEYGGLEWYSCPLSCSNFRL